MIPLTEDPVLDPSSIPAGIPVIYQFQRMFAFMSDIPLSEYIRRRKMSLAAVDLQRGRRIIDIALKYGYSSPTAFTLSLIHI